MLQAEALLVRQHLVRARLADIHQRQATELLEVTGDEGGRAVIARHVEEVALCELEDEGAGLDVDTPSDFARVRALWERR